MTAFRLLLVGVTALALGVVACQDDHSRLAEHLDRGKAYMDEEKPSEAIIEYKNALQIDPNDAAAHYGLAQAYMASQDVRKAYWELQETVRLDPSNLDARLGLGQFLLFGKQDEYGQALEQADAVIAADPSRWEAQVLRGRALESLKRLDEAKAAYEAAVQAQPERPELVRLLAGFHVRSGDREGAEPLYHKLTEMDPSAESYFALAGFLAQDRARDAEAEAAYRQALQVADDKEKSAAYRRLASFYYARERYDEAGATLEEGVDATDKDLDVLYALARFYHSRGAPERADAMIEEATKAHPDQVQPYLILSAYRGRNGDLDGALAAAESALQVDPDDTTARLRKAELLIDLGVRKSSADSLSQGRAIVEAILAGDPASAEGNFVAAKLSIAEKKYDDAATSLRKTLDARPDWAQAHYLLGSTLLLQGDRQEARAEVVRAVELDSEFRDARRLLARLYAELGEHDQAVEEARRLLRQDPDDIATRILLAQSLVHLGKLDNARTELEVIPLDERGPEVEFALGRIDQFQGKPDFARKKLLAALESRPYHPEILESLLQIDAAEGRLPESVARIKAAAEAKPDQAPLVRLYGLALLMSGEGPAAEAQLRHAIDLDPNDLDSYQALARYLIATRRFAESIGTYELAVKSRPDSAPLHFTLGALYEMSGRPADAMAQYEEAVRLDPKLGVAKNNLAYLMAESGNNLDRALDLAQEAKSQLPDSANAADTLGWVLYKKGIPEAAIGYLKEAEGGFPPDHGDLGTVRVHLALAYEANQEPAKARETLERALTQRQNAVDAAQQQGKEAPPEPPWVTEARSMLDRLGPSAGG
jgi:tetratricopeptide (TPR) repeat protein